MRLNFGFTMTNLSNEIETHLPHLRRYARAMTGSQYRGDQLAEATLVSLLANVEQMGTRLKPKIALFRLMQDLRQRDRFVFADDLTEHETIAQIHLAKLKPGSREALLLRALEQFSDHDIAEIMRLPAGQVADLVSTARLDIAKSITGRVLVIEDELAIAAEIESIVTDMGHAVIGNAPSKREAIRMAETDEPDLILSDIHLANNTTGIETVSEILGSYPRKPVIYITGFPEKLLTGIDQEPAFLITKPYSADQVRSAVSQAMFFAPRSLS